jgi:chromosome segregation ATPase
MKLIALEISNFQKIKLVKFDVGDGVTEIAGDNGQGKTSILDAITACLVGKKALPPVPVRLGEESAQIILDCDDVTVTRKIKPDGSGTLKVQSKDGMKPSSPQEWLNERIGAISFDPLSFMRLEPSVQAETLRKLVGVDTSDLDLARPKVYVQRTDVNRDAKAAEALLTSLPLHSDVSDEEVSTQSILDAIEAANKAQSEVASAIEKVSAIERSRAMLVAEKARIKDDFLANQESLNRSHAASLAELNERIAKAIATKGGIDANVQARQDEYLANIDRKIADLEAQIADLRAHRAGAFGSFTQQRDEAHAASDDAIASLKTELAQRSADHADTIDDAKARARKRTDEITEELAHLDERAIALQAKANADVPNVDDLKTQLRNVESNNAKARANKAHNAQKAKVAKLKDESAQLTAKLDEIDAERKSRISSATYPVPGLAFDENGLVTYDGLPLVQASMAQKIRVSMAIGIAMNPKLKLVLIRDASLLDNKSMAIVAEMAASNGAQVFLERINPSDKGSIIIEDGEVAS